LKRFIILGSTGSIGRSSLDVINSNYDNFRAVGLAADSSVDKMCEQILRFKPEAVSMSQPEAAGKVRSLMGSHTEIYEGIQGMNEMICSLDVDGVINGLVGSAGMMPTIIALENGKDVLLANKESMVMAGPVIVETANRYNRKIIPIDSEMSAIYQCIKGEGKEKIKRLILTASGGPFLDFAFEELRNVSVEQALNHPTWNMGTKNTIDSATMMNKGLEVIEASFLFGFPGEKIDITIHRSSISHSFVEFVDGSLLCQISKPDMRLAIQYAMTDPERLPSPYGGLDFSTPFTLTFEPPDNERFPCLSIAYEVLEKGGTATTAMNGANEQAVKMFVDGKISFMEIPELIKRVVDKHNFINDPTINELLETDQDAKRRINEMVQMQTG